MPRHPQQPCKHSDNTDITSGTWCNGITGHGGGSEFGDATCKHTGHRHRGGREVDGGKMISKTQSDLPKVLENKSFVL